MSETPNAIHHSVGEESSSTAPPPPPPSSGKASTSVLNSQESVILHEHSPSAPPLTDDHIETLEDGPVHYPTIDSTPVDVPSSSPLPASAEGEKKEDGSSGQCSICLDAPSDAVCAPCGHVAGCMSCLTEIKSKNYGCPVCRAKIDQIVKLYRVWNRQVLHELTWDNLSHSLCCEIKAFQPLTLSFSITQLWSRTLFLCCC